jgi:hypothetical protein
MALHRVAVDAIHSVLVEVNMRVGESLYSRREIECRVGNLQQLGGIRHFEFTEGRARGVRAAEFATGTGLNFTVLPDRGLDIAECSFKGTNMAYLASGGIAHPAYYNPAGLEWLRVFFGGLLTTCGLTYFGHPCRDGGEDLGLHGRYSAIPAARVCDLSRWEGDRFILEISGVVEECAPFGDKIRLTRSLSSALDSRSLRISDRVENFGARSSPFTILYHINIGFPLLDAGSEFAASSRIVEPHDPRSSDRMADLGRFDVPVRDFAELNYLHTMSADPRGYAHAAFINRGLAGGTGLSISFTIDTLPFLNEWKMLSETDYVVGIEPANTPVADRASLRSQGRLLMLEPGETREMELEIGVLEGMAAIDGFVAEVQKIRR